MFYLKINTLCLILFVMIKYSCSKNPVITLDNIISDKNNWTWPKVDSLLKFAVDGIIGSNFKYLKKFVTNLKISNSCEEAFFAAVLQLRQNRAWTIKMIDASGKIPSGVLDGTVMDFGSFDECLSIRVSSNDKNEYFRGKYCMVGLKHPLISTPQESNFHETNYTKLYGVPPPWIGDQMARAKGFMKQVGFYLGICIPSLCSNQDVQEIAQSVGGVLGFHASIADCQKDESRSMQPSEIGAFSTLSCLLAFVIIGSLIDTIQRIRRWGYGKTWLDMKTPLKNNAKENWFFRIMKFFSAISNTEKLLGGANASGSMLSFLHGIRFLSATWIILGHTYFFVDTWMYLKYRHLLGVTEKFNRNLPAAVIENFTIPVGSFFFISGFLMIYTNWTKLEKNGGKLNLFIFFFHKYWRMTPALGLTIALFLAMPYIGSGPLWNTTFDPEIKICINNWWKSLIYVSNWWDSDEFCLIHTWYLSALMQFHIIGALLLLLVFKWPLCGLATGLLLVAASCSYTALQVIWKNFPMPAPGLVRDMDVIKNYNSDVYIKPYAHFASYMIGMICGFLVVKYRFVKLSITQKTTGWIMATCLALTAVYGIYGSGENIVSRAAYISLHRISWALAIAWLTFCCVTKSAGLINKLLSWSAFQPLGQLSYLAYLLHPLVILYRNGSLRERVYYSHTELVLTFLSNVVISFFLAFLCYITIELPFSALETIVLKRSHFYQNKVNSGTSNGTHQKSNSNANSTNVHAVSFTPNPSESSNLPRRVLSP